MIRRAGALLRLIGWRWPLAILVLSLVIRANRDAFSGFVTMQLAGRWVIAAALMRLAPVVLMGLRWYYLASQNQLPFTVTESLRLTFLGEVAGFLGAGLAGSDVARTSMVLQRTPSRRTAAIALVLFDRMLGLLALVALGTIFGILVLPGLTSPTLVKAIQIQAFIAATGILLLFAVTSRSSVLMRLFGVLRRLSVPTFVRDRISECWDLVHGKRAVAFGALLLAILGHILNISAFYCCSRAISSTTPAWTTQMAIVPASEVVAALTPVPGGIGTREAMSTQLFGELPGLEGAMSMAQLGLLSALCFSALSFLVIVPIGLYVLMPTTKSSTTSSSVQ